MMTSIALRIVAATIRRLTLPTFVVLALGYWLFGSAVFDIAQKRVGRAADWIGATWHDWLDYGERRRFDAAEERFREALEQRREVSEQVDVLRRQRDELAGELSRETLHFERNSRLFQMASEANDEAPVAAAQVEAALRRQADLRARMHEVDRMLAALNDALAKLDADGIQVWTALREQAFDHNRRRAWRSAEESYGRSRQLLEDLPGHTQFGAPTTRYVVAE